MIETRLIPEMTFNCSGTLVEWMVSGRAGNGTMYPKLQIWRKSSRSMDLYHKIGPEIQIDAEGSACETISQTCGQVFRCQLSSAYQVSVFSGIDIIGVELPHLDDQGFELYFTSSMNNQYVWRQELHSSSVSIDSRAFLVTDDLLLSVDVVPGELTHFQ